MAEPTYPELVDIVSQLDARTWAAIFAAVVTAGIGTWAILNQRGMQKEKMEFDKRMQLRDKCESYYRAIVAYEAEWRAVHQIQKNAGTNLTKRILSNEQDQKLDNLYQECLLISNLYIPTIHGTAPSMKAPHDILVRLLKNNNYNVVDRERLYDALYNKIERCKGTSIALSRLDD